MELTADCSRCVGLCCVVLPFARSADFAFDKAPGEPCRHLAGDHRCRIHDRLLDSGMRGCVAYDCFGAGQAVTQTGRVEAFHEVEQVHEIAWYLTEAVDRGADAAGLLAETEALAAAPHPTTDRSTTCGRASRRCCARSPSTPGRRTKRRWRPPGTTSSARTCEARTCAARTCAARC